MLTVPVATKATTNYNYPCEKLNELTQYNFGKTLILDLDGTIRNDNHRIHLLPNEKTLEMFAPNLNAAFNKYQMEAKYDTPIAGNIQMVKQLQSGKRMRTIVLSAATGSKRLHSVLFVKDQLRRWGIDYYAIVMRHEDDQTPPVVQKCKMITDLRFSDMDDVYAMDDDPQIIDAYSAMGITTLQVKRGR